MANFAPNPFIYFFISQKIMAESKIKNKERIINDNFKKFNNTKNTIHIEKNGINARILLTLVFFAVKTFKP